jgi:hypothetical protein
MIQFICIAFPVITKMRWVWKFMTELKKPLEQISEIQTDGGQIKETDQMGREKFWEDLGRPND